MAVSRSQEKAIQQQREQAWLGDAALSLLVREWLLEREGRIEAELFADLTSNRFLSRLGSPTAVEAEIGRAYRDGGLDGARRWLRERLLPHFEKSLNRRHARS
jgi:dsRNA-specific ribonuclease